ncbi:MAG: RCC1 domain-containing protein [Gemmatimonadales bacterium]
MPPTPPPAPPPPPARLGFAVQPTSAEEGQPLTPAPQVAIQDALGNTVPSSTNVVTVALGTNPGGGTLAGTTTVNAVNGVATFNGLTIDRPGSDYTLVATSGALSSTTSAAFAIHPPAPAKLGFAVQPTPTQGTRPITPAPQVAIQDVLGNTVPSATSAVTVAMGPNPGGGTLAGTTTVNAVNGVATFNGLTIDRPGSGYRLVATSGALRSEPSAAFAIRLTFTSVGSGPGATCGVTTASAAYCWGYNFSGELGDGTTTSQPSPVLVAGGLSFATASVLGSHTCGVTTTGAAYCWGYNGRGQLGDGTAIDRSSPVLVSGGLTFAAVGPAGGDFTCGVTTAGAGYCWGANEVGQLGDGTTTSRTSPVLVAGGQTFSMVTGGSKHACGVTMAGAAYCWGFNGQGLLGDGTTTHRTSPVLVAGALTFATISARYQHTCGVTTAGTTYCWGVNDRGQLGDGTTTSRSSPVLVAGGLTLAAVSAGDNHNCGVTPAGAAYCWGYNFKGRLGDGTSTSRLSPVPVVGGLSFATVSAGRNHTCGVTTAGAAYCWGENDLGQLGTGNTSSSLVPVLVVQ